jgi:hypothetical protein
MPQEKPEEMEGLQIRTSATWHVIAAGLAASAVYACASGTIFAAAGYAFALFVWWLLLRAKRRGALLEYTAIRLAATLVLERRDGYKQPTALLAPTDVQE